MKQMAGYLWMAIWGFSDGFFRREMFSRMLASQGILRHSKADFSCPCGRIHNADRRTAITISAALSDEKTFREVIFLCHSLHIDPWRN